MSHQLALTRLRRRLLLFAVAAVGLAASIGLALPTTSAGGGVIDAGTATTKTVALSGPVHAGESWVIELDGTDYSYAVQSGDTLAAVAAGLAAAVDAAAGFAAHHEGTVVVITRLDGAIFTTSFRIDVAGAGLIDETTARTATVTLSGPLNPGDQLVLTLDGTDYAHTVDLGEDTATVAASLVALIDPLSGFAAAVEGSTIAITRIDGAVFAIAFTTLAADADSDGVPDVDDNCTNDVNPGQEDFDGDGQGDVCDGDDDGDGVDDGTDNCPSAANAGQEDQDNDSQGDACDPDRDGDGIADGSDNCPGVANAAQTDTDGDDRGDACDSYSFGGVRPPVDSRPTVNSGRSGKTYPIKFPVSDPDGKLVTSLAAVASIKHKAVPCGVFSGDPTDALETTAAGGTGLRIDAEQFVYNWQTPAAPGCYELFVTLADGGVHSANFSLR